MNFTIYPPKTPIAGHIFNFPIHWYGIIMAIAIFVGIILSSYLISKKYSKKEEEIFLDIIPYVIIFSIIGARVFYVLGNIDFYLKNLNEIILINHGGLSIFGGLAFGIISFVILAKKNKLEILKYLDILALVLPLSQSIGRWGNYFNQEAYGYPINFAFVKLFVEENYRNPEFIDIQYYHPTFLYESVLDFILFVFLMFIFLKFKKYKKGSIFYIYLMFYSIIRLFVEYFRIDSILYVDNFPIASVISFFTLICAFVLFIYNFKKSPKG